MADSNSVYGTAQPLQGSVVDWVNNREQMDFAYREEARKEAQLKQLAKDREQAKRDAVTKRYGEIKKVAPTGIKSIDEAYAIWADQAMDKQLELYKKEMSGQPLTPQEAALYKKIEMLPETLALMTKSYQEDAARYVEGVKGGKIKRDLDYELKLQQMPDKAIAFLDDDLNPVIGMDNDADGKPDIFSYDMNGFSLKPNIIENVDLDKSIKAVTDTLDTTRNVTDSNFTKRTTEGIPLSVAKAAANGMIYTQDGSITPLAKSYLYDSGIRDFSQLDQKSLDGLETLLTDRILNSKKQINETDVDYGAMTGASRERRLAAKDAKEDAPAIGNPVVPTPETWGRQYKFLDTKNYKSVPITGKVTLPSIEITLEDENGDGKKERLKANNPEVLNYTYNKDGDLYLDLSYKKARQSTETDDGRLSEDIVDKVQVQASKETEARIAKILGLTVQEMKDRAKNLDAPQPTAEELIAKYRPK